MNEIEFERALADLISDYYSYVELEEEEPVVQIDYVRRFCDCGLLTLNRGLVLTTDDGSEFQVTIVRSR